MAVTRRILIVAAALAPIIHPAMAGGRDDAGKPAKPPKGGRPRQDKRKRDCQQGEKDC
mgnify:CR=1 FL=1